MRSTRLLAIGVVAFLALGSCRRDSNSAKKHYLESGDKYFAKGRYKEAAIQYGNSIKIDPRFGPGYYKLGLTDLKLQPALVVKAIGAFRRSVELLRNDQAYQPEYRDSMVKLSELYLMFMKQDKQAQEEVQAYCDLMLSKDPASFDGHRLEGDLSFLKALIAFGVANKDEGNRLVGVALAEYRKADAAKPGDLGVTLQLARALETQSQYAEAEQLLQKVIDKDKNSAAGYQELYLLYARQGKTADEERVLKLAFANNPRQYEYLVELARFYGLQNRRDDMLAVLQQIKSYAKDWPQAYQRVGDFYLQTGDGESALREYREGIAKDPKKKPVYEKRIIEVLMRQGKRTEAAEVNSQILKEDPNDSDARSLAAAFLLDRGDINKALLELQAVVTRSPENFVAHYQLGRAHAARREWEQARQQFQKAIELRPDYILARLALAQLEVTLGQFEAAYNTAEEILTKYDKGSINARLIESAALMGQKRYGDSRNLLDGMLKASPNSPDVYFQMGVVNLAENKYKDADDAFRRAYELNPANSRGLMGIVETDMAQNKADAAMQLLQVESKKSPNRLDLILALGKTAVRAGRYDEAAGYFQRVLDGLDKSAKVRGEIYLLIGETYRRKGDDNSAIANLQKAREFLPEDQTVLATLALVLDHGGRRNDAMQVYQTALKFDPGNGVALNNLAFLMAETNQNLDTALTYGQRAKAVMPNVPEISDTLGWILLKKTMYDQAIDVFKDLVVRVPANSTYHLHLAMAYSQKGDRAKAIAEAKEALKYTPTQDEQRQAKDLLAKSGG